jgi:hypothetical protein
MNNNEVAEAVAVLTGAVADKIKGQVRTLIKLALADIHSLVPGFWTKINETFTLGTSGTDAYLVDLKAEFPDFWSLRFLWTTDGPINYITEKKFHNEVPNPSEEATGVPNRYFFREKSLIELFPRNSSSRTIYISYRYKPKFDDISDLPEEWHFVPFYYIMGLFEGFEKDYFKRKYADGLNRMMNFAREAEEAFAEIMGDGQDEIIYDDGMEVSR